MNTPRPVTLLLLLATACTPEISTPSNSGDSQEFRWEGTIEKFGSVTTVRNPNSGIWDDAPVPPLRFEPDGLFGGPETQIEGIAAAIVDANSNVYIYDNHRHELVGMDPEGTILWRAGQEGKGPGEFSAVRGAAYDGDKTIYLVNQEGTRLDAWKTNGTLSGNVELAELGIGKTFMGGFLPPNRVALLADDVFSSATNAYIIVELGDEPRVTITFESVRTRLCLYRPALSYS